MLAPEDIFIFSKNFSRQKMELDKLNFFPGENKHGVEN